MRRDVVSLSEWRVSAVRLDTVQRGQSKCEDEDGGDVLGIRWLRVMVEWEGGNKRGGWTTWRYVSRRASDGCRRSQMCRLG